jgi:hypothetical protein
LPEALDPMKLKFSMEALTFHLASKLRISVAHVIQSTSATKEICLLWVVAMVSSASSMSLLLCDKYISIPSNSYRLGFWGFGVLGFWV